MSETGTALQKNEQLLEVEVEAQRFELAQRKAAIYAKSTLVPKEYQNNIGNVLIATNMAQRMGADLLMVMQNLYVVQGRPGWSSQFLIASFNSNGRFSAIKYRFTGEPYTDEWGCQAYCTELSTGEEIEGATITWAMAKNEGWSTKNGSKWRTMPEQMFRYRSAAFLIRSTAPEIGMGLLTKEELQDMAPSNAELAAEQAGIAGLKSRLAGDAAEPVNIVDEATIDGEVITDEPEVTHSDAEIHESDPPIMEQPTVPMAMDKDESKLEDLRAAATDIYRGLDGNAKLLANQHLGTKEIKKLKRDELMAFIDTFGS